MSSCLIRDYYHLIAALHQVLLVQLPVVRVCSIKSPLSPYTLCEPVNTDLVNASILAHSCQTVKTKGLTWLLWTGVFSLYPSSMIDVLHVLRYHLPPSLHLYEVVQSRVVLVTHLTRTVVKHAETCDEEDLTRNTKTISLSQRRTMLLIHNKEKWSLSSSHLFLSTFSYSRLRRLRNTESRSSVCPQRVHLSVRQQQQAIYNINW